MGSKVLISPEQYLATYYEREPEYVRGELKEKPLPDAIHSWIQRILLMMFVPATNGLVALGELRCRVASDVYRLPDVAVFQSGERISRVPDVPPLAVIEIVSEDERHVDLVAKLRDYAAWPVPNIWVVDPWTKQLAVWRNDTLVPVDVLRLQEHRIEVRLSALLQDSPVDFS
jgi:Uma2 family endonuclease